MMLLSPAHKQTFQNFFIFRSCTHSMMHARSTGGQWKRAQVNVSCTQLLRTIGKIPADKHVLDSTESYTNPTCSPPSVSTFCSSVLGIPHPSGTNVTIGIPSYGASDGKIKLDIITRYEINNQTLA